MTRSQLFAEHDSSEWVYLPKQFPYEEFASLDHWVESTYNDVLVRLELKEDLIGWFRETLRTIAGLDLQGLDTFVRVKDPIQHVMIIVLGSYVETPSMTLDELIGPNGAECASPPVVEDFENPHLGLGRKSRLMLIDEVGAVYGYVRWAWRIDGREIILTASEENVAMLARIEPEIDDFARGIGMESLANSEKLEAGQA